MTAHRGARISEAEFRRLWLDATLSCADIGARLGIGGAAVSSRAKRRGLPTRDRPFASPRPRKCDTDEVRAMWQAGVYVQSLATHCGVAVRTVYNAARRNGWTRPRTNLWTGMTVAEYRTAVARASLMASARETAGAMRDAEMIDGLRSAARVFQPGLRLQQGELA